ncbi:MAG: clan AA aspartic protease [Chloroflexi bacterium]|nr:clan AA aspartic protease [Chloroflexota bacterium]
MLNGRINDELQAWVSVEILDGAGGVHPVEVLLDTGFNGELALTSSVIRRLNLARGTPRFAELATGDTTLLPSYTATILWDGLPRSIQVVEADGERLLGMELLLGSRVTLDVTEGGPVTIDALP